MKVIVLLGKPDIAACLLLVALLFCNAGCSQRPMHGNLTMPTETAKVRVSSEGKIYFNDRIITYGELSDEFKKLKKKNGGVWFLDESFVGSSRQQGQMVRKAIIDAGLPMRIR